MNTRSTKPRRTGVRMAIASAMTLTMAFGAVACGPDQPEPSADDAATSEAAGAVNGIDAAAARRGEELSRTQGCAGCHGANFDGGAGPSWIGLAGSQVTLQDATTIVADEAYLVRAIAEPSADLIADYTLQMPANGLTDNEIADIVAYINTLADG